MKVALFPFIFVSTLLTSWLHGDASVHIADINKDTLELQVTIPVAQKDMIYSDYISFSIDDPAISLSSTWHSPADTVAHFDPLFKETKQGFVGDTLFNLQATLQDAAALEKAHLHISYYKKSAHKMVTEVIPLIIKPEPLLSSIAVTDITSQEITSSEQTPKAALVSQCEPKKSSLSDKISDLIKRTDSLTIRIILVLLLGLLMSLTPCIYPMIPITAGILQSQASSSLLRNFLLATSYTLGIAMTFAGLGLLAAYTGQMCGSFFTNPIFIICVVALLAYLAGSMLGLYEMYIPKIMQPKHQNVKKGSFVSAFLFGAASGTFASPCLSPGLCLLLSIVSAMKSVAMGFVLLFAFGIGLSLPLLLIGSFSSSLALLPRAGMWMVEVKKMFGIIMLLMCLYFLNFVLPFAVILWLAAAVLLISGVWYFTTVASYDSKAVRTFKNSVGTICVAIGLIVAFNAYLYSTAVITPEQHAQEDFWLHDFDQAVALAQETDKDLFVDVGAPYCSICKAIDKTLFAQKTVQEALQEKFICVKIDGSAPHNEVFTKRYKIMGFPAIMILDAQKLKVINRWGGELYGIKPEEFIKKLNE